MKINKTYIIAEIGLNYAFGSDRSKFLDNAKDLIDIAVAASCDAVKFQKRTPDLCVPEEQKTKEKTVPWRDKPTTYLQYKKDIEFSEKEYDEINRYCKEKNIEWSASPWDVPSVLFLKKYSLNWVKIASPTMTNRSIVEEVLDDFPIVIISTGMSTEKEIKDMMRHCNFQHHTEPPILVLMHCNSSYPAHVKDLNLSYILKLKEIYPNIKIGYSGHEFGLVSSIAAVYLGAEYIERHITLSRDNWGSDQLASVEPAGLNKLVKGIRDLELAFGDGVKKITDEEKVKRKQLRNR